MKFTLIIIFLFSIQSSFSQDSIQSHKLEIEGWKFYFNENKKDAYQKFLEAIEVDTTNIYAKIGLLNSKNENEFTKRDSDWIFNLPETGDYKELVFALMMTSQVDKELGDSIKIMRNKYDEEYIQFKARLTDSEFKVFDEDGEVRQTGAFKNRKPFGTWKKYGYQNKLHHSFTFPKTGDTVIIKYFKSDGDVIKEEWTTGMPFTNDSKRFKEIIYWQEKPGKEKGYLFVSKEGFKIYDRENPVVLDNTTPDNIIQVTWNTEKNSQEAFIWKNGKREPYDFCPDDGIIVTYLEDGKKKSFRWENCEKIPIDK